MNRGFVLIIVIGLMGLLAFIGVAFINIADRTNNLSQAHLMNVKVDILTFSGLEYALAKTYEAITFDETIENRSVGEGTFKHGGDTFGVTIFDHNGQININDGILAGETEVAHKRPNDLDKYFNHYHANELQVYPRYAVTIDDWDSIDDPIKVYVPEGATQPSASDVDLYERARSALINLRLRRILNAYGDVHRFVDHAYNDDYNNLVREDYSIEAFVNGEKTLPNPVFSITPRSSSDNDRRQNMAGILMDTGLGNGVFNNGLGDRIIENRPQGGYKRLDEVKSIIDQWAQSIVNNISIQYTQGQSFYERIKDDLSVLSWQDTSFSRLDTEMRFGDYKPRLSYYNGEDRGNIKPRDIAYDPLNFEDMWIPHPVAVIDLNEASFFVKAAVFYAPTNVSYACESATTVFPYGDIEATQGPGRIFDTHMALESMICLPSVGVGPPVFNRLLNDQGIFDDYSTIEHGLFYKGRNNHLISMRDALNLAYKYEKYGTDESNGLIMPKRIKNFNEFCDFLKTFKPGPGGVGGGGTGVGGTGAGGVGQGSHDQESDSIEKFSDEPSSISWQEIVGFEKVINDPTYYDKESDVDFNHKHFHVSDYEDASTFLYDYVEKTLPHIFSCVRRIPSYLGAPAALQSPYILLKPDHSKYQLSGQEGIVCEQPFRKVEDFVWRFMHPKVIFTPGGYKTFQVVGSIHDINNQLVSQKIIKSTVKVFETKYFRSQYDFIGITDTQTDQDIRIGPNYLDNSDQVMPDKFLGFVGLKDFEDDLSWHKDRLKRDIFMVHEESSGLGGYKPQIVMNFNPNKDGFHGFINTSLTEDSPQSQNPDDDLWKEAVNISSSSGEAAKHLDDSQMDSVTVAPMFGDTRESNGMCDLSPFGGARFSSMGHGEFTENGFSDSLYWRMDSWLGGGIDNPVGKDLSAGIITFWFQIPSTYDYPVFYIDDFDNNNVMSYTYLLAQLNLWESYQYSVDHFPLLRPVSISVGLKRTPQRGFNVFARYDSGAESYLPTTSFPSYSAPNGYGLFNLQALSRYDQQITQYDSLSFWCHHDGDIAYQEDSTPNYSSYRWPTHRSSEVSVSLGEGNATAPGSWHRASVFWNLRWDMTSQDQMQSSKQLFVDLHDYANKKRKSTLLGEILPNEFHQQVSSAPQIGYSAGDPFYYPRDQDPIKHGGNIGFVHPFNASMVLSLGEGHLRRHQPAYFNDGTMVFSISSQINYYYPAWRLNSTIDNVRLWMGPSNPVINQIPSQYFDASFVETTARQNAYAAMRYKVMKAHPDFHQQFTDQDHEPKWIIDPKLPKNAKLLSLGSRIYYPPDQGIAPYVLFEASNHQDVNQPLTVDAVDIATNEQDYIFNKQPISDIFRIYFQYKAHRPVLNAQPYDQVQQKLNYSAGDAIDIAWIKEISIRYSSQDYPLYLSVNKN